MLRSGLKVMRRSVAFWSLGTLAAISSRGLLVLAALPFLMALLVLVVVVPAIWSREKVRRDAALAVLDRLAAKPR